MEANLISCDTGSEKANEKVRSVLEETLQKITRKNLQEILGGISPEIPGRKPEEISRRTLEGMPREIHE